MTFYSKFICLKHKTNQTVFPTYIAISITVYISHNFICYDIVMYMYTTVGKKDVEHTSTVL